MDFKDSKTAGNLAKAFAGESQARNRYTYYASTARKEGYEHIARVFEETAENEKEHAAVFFKYLVEGQGASMVTVDATYPVGRASTAENLQYAADGEKEEHSILYPEFARIADEEGYKDIANTFRQIASVEKHHEARYLTLQKLVAENKYFNRDEETEWICINCGYIYTGKSALKLCPSCKHGQEWFAVNCDVQ